MNEYIINKNQHQVTIVVSCGIVYLLYIIQDALYYYQYGERDIGEKNGL